MKWPLDGDLTGVPCTLLMLIQKMSASSIGDTLRQLPGYWERDIHGNARYIPVDIWLLDLHDDPLLGVPLPNYDILHAWLRIIACE